MDKLENIKQIYQRLSNLEDMREQLRLTREHGEIDFMLNDIDTEMTELRSKLRDIMNVICPIVKSQP
jgi:hypothetical protein